MLKSRHSGNFSSLENLEILLFNIDYSDTVPQKLKYRLL